MKPLMRISEQTVIDFIKRNLEYSNFPSPVLERFKQLAKEGKDIAAAKEYCDATGAKLEEAHLAISVVTKL